MKHKQKYTFIVALHQPQASKSFALEKTSTSCPSVNSVDLDSLGGSLTKENGNLDSGCHSFSNATDTSSSCTSVTTPWKQFNSVTKTEFKTNINIQQIALFRA